MDVEAANIINSCQENEDQVDPIHDIIDYLVRCANISFKNSHVDEAEVKTNDKIQIAYDIYKRSPTSFLTQFGKYLSPNHISYFDNLQPTNENDYMTFKECIKFLTIYHSDKCRHKRIRNRRFKAMQKMQEETDYFSEKEMMYRNPLLYEQLIGRYLDDEEILRRDAVKGENVSFLKIILDTVDMNEMKETKHKQMLEENLESELEEEQKSCEATDTSKSKRQWGDFDIKDPKPSYKFQTRADAVISSHERNLLREEFYQEMYSSFMEGRDDIDYSAIDNNENYDDLQQISQDAEDRYFDSEANDVNNLEEHMKLVEEYGQAKSKDMCTNDPLDEFMQHIQNKSKQ